MDYDRTITQALWLVFAVWALIVHGVFPFLFETVGSRTVASVNEHFVSIRNKQATSRLYETRQWVAKELVTVM